MRFFALALLLATAPSLAPVQAQSSATAADANISQDFAQDGGTTYFSQAWLIDTMERRTGSLDQVPYVRYRYHVIP